MPPASSNPYRKLPGSGGSPFLRHRLWLGKDHILSVASSAIGERYRRFYFSDIQAVVWRPSATLSVRASFWFVIAALCGLGAASSVSPAREVYGAIAGLFVIFFVVDLALGKTCACFVKTAVQFERLPSLGRERTVRKVLTQVRPMIEQAQTTSTPAQPTVASSQ